MHPLLRLALPLLALTLPALRAGEPAAKSKTAAAEPAVAALRAADDARVSATIRGDAAALGTLLSDELRYTHSSGSVDTKAVFIEALASGRIRYHAMDYEERNFQVIAPGVALMSGRGRFKPARAGSPPSDLHLSFLAVWRQEQGQWRFIAWQSARIPEPAAGKK